MNKEKRMKKWISTVIVFFLGSGLVACSSMTATKQQESAWQTASQPLAPPVATAAKSPTAQTAKAAQKPKTDANATDQFLSLWRALPSTQWFVNDMQQQELS